MRHSANKLTDVVDILGADGTTTLASGARAGISDLSGKRLEQAQLRASETSHMILFRYADATAVTESSYVRGDGVLYIVDYKSDAFQAEPPRAPRPKMWLEVYCHVERASA